ncbi:hypothetical protein HBI56_059340 [Parastagonospora nodorum]|uniref:Uncharacterized protein n=1 Tax=Phaeosphaeria nodorum (strain SN15 / ATCC MYA-4574 / FGSC 10173) TaxID=321614 RepID=A0A7U2I0D5_PHANO|nr:hypothetical protein HBH56_159280 [Parastagonospora nodorum]QRC97318.1 hypothetical protein JI435_410440 [Parastagonospora nodorum SN15]KAH3922452.1 hypothetical protein HBH54_223710 [Parastagonospora nodorum]KAH3947048.1 hypothetical protein HBH53_122630 [Parastagonospora nodorum]KAH3969519.1 hypothetical protein HBH52_170650 [Parastagonospora nodorum]
MQWKSIRLNSYNMSSYLLVHIAHKTCCACRQIRRSISVRKVISVLSLFHFPQLPIGILARGIRDGARGSLYVSRVTAMGLACALTDTGKDIIQHWSPYRASSLRLPQPKMRADSTHRIDGPCRYGDCNRQAWRQWRRQGLEVA